MAERPATLAGTVKLGDLSVQRMGFGAMRAPSPIQGQTRIEWTPSAADVGL